MTFSPSFTSFTSPSFPPGVSSASLPSSAIGNLADPALLPLVSLVALISSSPFSYTSLVASSALLPSSLEKIQIKSSEHPHARSPFTRAARDHTDSAGTRICWSSSPVDSFQILMMPSSPELARPPVLEDETAPEEEGEEKGERESVARA